MCVGVKYCHCTLLHAPPSTPFRSPLLQHPPPSLQLEDGRSFQTKARFDTDVELVYFSNGGILNYMIRKMLV